MWDAIKRGWRWLCEKPVATLVGVVAPIALDLVKGSCFLVGSLALAPWWAIGLAWTAEVVVTVAVFRWLRGNPDWSILRSPLAKMVLGVLLGAAAAVVLALGVTVLLGWMAPFIGAFVWGLNGFLGGLIFAICFYVLAAAAAGVIWLFREQIADLIDNF